MQIVSIMWQKMEEEFLVDLSNGKQKRYNYSQALESFGNRDEWFYFEEAIRYYGNWVKLEGYGKQ